MSVLLFANLLAIRKKADFFFISNIRLLNCTSLLVLKLHFFLDSQQGATILIAKSFWVFFVVFFNSLTARGGF